MSDEFHTVAVTLRGTNVRVMVERMQGHPIEACEAARNVVYAFAQNAPKNWLTEIVSTQQITDVPTTPETF